MRRWGMRLLYGSSASLLALMILNSIVTLGSQRLIHSSQGINFQPQPVLLTPWETMLLRVWLIAGCLGMMGGKILCFFRGRHRTPFGVSAIQTLGWVAFWFFIGQLALSLMQAMVPSDIGLSEPMQILQQVWLQLESIFVILTCYRGRREEIGLVRPIQLGRLLLLSLAGTVLVISLGEVSAIFNQTLHVSSQSYRESAISGAFAHARELGLTNVVLQMIATSIIAPIGEELIFRGVIQSGLARRLRRPSSILLSSILFTLFHADINLAAVIFVVGLLLGAIYAYSGRLYGSMVVHALNNAVSSLSSL